MRKKVKPKKKVKAKSQLNKYLAYMDLCRSGVVSSPPWIESGYSVWCVVKIQSWFRMIRKQFNHRLKRHVLNQIAAIVIQTAWKNSDLWLSILMRMKAQYAPERFDIDVEATRIQRAFRAYCNTRVYKYLKELVLVKFKGAPADLLRCIVPGEVDLFDKAAGVHVRFRLGGAVFPPKILFKVFTHRALCDVNAFAPRAYCKEKPMDTLQLHNHVGSIPPKHLRQRPLRVGGRYFDTILTTNTSNGEGWYRRDDKNQWRPIATQVIDEEYVPQWLKDTLREKKPTPYHFSRLKRQEDVDARKKRRRREWVMKAYRMAAGDDILEDTGVESDRDRAPDGGGSVHTAGSASRMSDKYRDNFGMCNTANGGARPRGGESDQRWMGGGENEPLPIAMSLDPEHLHTASRGSRRGRPEEDGDRVYRSPSRREVVQSLSCDDGRGQFVGTKKSKGIPLSSSSSNFANDPADLRYLPPVYKPEKKPSRSIFGGENRSRHSRDMAAYRSAVAKAEEEDIVKWG